MLKHSPTYIFHAIPKGNESLKVYSMSSSYYYDDWDELVYAKLLHYYLSQFYEIDFESIYSAKEEKCITFIRNEDGSFLDIPVDARISFTKLE